VHDDEHAQVRVWHRRCGTRWCNGPLAHPHTHTPTHKHPHTHPRRTRFACNDLFTFNAVNLDVLTETYNLPFYLQYLARWPEYCRLAEGPGRQAMGYILGKAEGSGESWHGHVTAVTVAPDFRRQALARKLMATLEEITHKVHDAYFVDLFVRVSNAVAINMYRSFGYSVYRRVLQYYSGEEDAYDMRKAMPRDVHGRSVVPLPHPVRPDELEFD
jgi:N-terminal acetyltransferase B complex catalytic subunit